MVSRKILKIAVLATLALSLGMITPLFGQDEEGQPFLGLWQRTSFGRPDQDLLFYRLTLRYQARMGLYNRGLLPAGVAATQDSVIAALLARGPAPLDEIYRAEQDSLGLGWHGVLDFAVVQESLGLGWLPPPWLKVRGSRDLLTHQISPSFDSLAVEDNLSLRGAPVRPPWRTSMAAYLAAMSRRNFRSIWAERAGQTLESAKPGAGGGQVFSLPWKMPSAVRGVLGEGKPNLTVRGSERISFSGTSRWFPDRPETEFMAKQSKFPQLDMKQELNLQLTGNVGDKVSVNVDQSSQASTPLSNRIQIHYKGYSDEIIQRVDLGNTSLQLPGTQYVSYGGRHEGLFGINAQALVGDVEVTGILSKQEGKNETKSFSKSAERTVETISDFQYRQGKFFFLIDPSDPPLVDQLTSISVYVDDRNGLNNLEQQTVPGYVTLTGEFTGPETRAVGDWEILTPNEDYVVQYNVYAGYPVLILSDGHTLDGSMMEALAVAYRYERDGVAFTVGGSRGSQPDSLVLKLLRPAEGMGATNPFDLTEGIFAATRSLELRNVYDLGSNLSPDGLNVVIRRNRTEGGVISPDVKGDFTYLQILGLDLYTESGASQVPGPDARVDSGRLDYNSGYLIFRELHPFAPTDEDIRRWFGEARPDTLLEEEYRVPSLYTRADWSKGPDPNLVSQYKIEVTAQRPATRISLGAFNILQGSENVTASGRTLIRDRDYTIDYDTGDVQILDAADLRETDEVSVSYSYLPFGGGGNKTLLGGALRYLPQGSKFGLSTTWVYESKAAPGVEGRRPRLGQEPTRTFVGEFATSYKTDSWAITKMVDALPGVRTLARSNINLDAGLGMSFPNPNTRGELYVDDFEGAKDVFNVSLNRLTWKPSGVPRDTLGISLPVEQRGEVWWYTPRAAVKEGDLQPTREEAGGLADTEKDNNRQILEVHLFPAGETPEQRRQSWTGVIQPLSTRGTDLSRAQFLDLWVNDFRTRQTPEGSALREGRIHVDIGVLSEDAVWQRVDPGSPPRVALGAFAPPNGQLDTEDQNRDGQLDDPGGGLGEDTGIDGLRDAQEGSGTDPAFDNWDFEEAESEDSNREMQGFPRNEQPREQDLSALNRFKGFRNINGTERNGNGRVDTEDLNNNQILDTSESYFSMTIDLADTTLVEFESSLAPDQEAKYAPYTSGWRRIRVPLTPKYYTKFNGPIWEQVRHLRIWFDGFGGETVLQLGGVEITGNRWLAGGIYDSTGVKLPQDELEARGESFFPAVLNNKDNTAEYQPPYNPREQKGVEEREQTLTLEMQNFGPGHRSSAYRTFATPQNFTNQYATIEFYLNQRIREGPPDPDLRFFIRFARDPSTDERNYYEYEVPVGDGWALRSVNMGVLSRLQLLGSDSTSMVLDDGATIRRIGNPSLTSIQRIAVGVVNAGSTSVVNGSVWVDELRLGGVKRDTGIAGRAALSMGLADLGSMNLSYTTLDADFLSIGKEQGSGVTNTSLNFGTRVNLEKFYERANLRLPVSFNVSRSRAVPKFRPQGDLILTDPRDSDITETTGQDVQFSIQRNRSQNPWMRYTVDAISVSGNARRNVNNNPNDRDTTTVSSGSVAYSLPLQGGPPIRIYRTTDLRLLPTGFSMNVNGQRQNQVLYRRKNGDLTQEVFERVDRTPTKSATLGWSTGLRPLEAVTYTFDQGRDLLLDIGARKIAGVNIGAETSRRHQLGASQSVRLFKGAVVPKVSWSGGSDNRFAALGTGGTEVTGRSNSFSNNSTLTFAGALPIQRLFDMLPSLRPGGGGSERKSEAAADTTGERPATNEEGTGGRRGRRGGSGQSGSTSSGPKGKFLSIGAVNSSYTIARSKRLDKVTGDASIPFQLGLSQDAGGGIKSIYGQTGNNTVNLSQGSTSERKDLTFSTDLRFLTDIVVRTAYGWNRSENAVNLTRSHNTSVKFPDFDVNWGSRMHKKLGLDRWTKEFRASTRYTREVRERGNQTNPLETRETSISLRPFLNLDATLNSGISAKLASSYTRTSSEQFGLTQNVSNSRTRQLTLTLRKTVNLARALKNPVTGKRTKTNTRVDVSTAIELQDSWRESGPVGSLVTLEDRMKFVISATAGYQFTSAINGSAGLSFGQDTDRKTQSNTARYISATISAAFSF